MAADVGGGDGRDSEWLAGQGHDVTLVDESVEMLKIAKQRGAKIRVFRGDAGALLERNGPDHFDLVLSHGVLMYDLDQPQDHLDQLVQLLHKGGVLSLLTKGFGGTAERLNRQAKAEELKHLQDTHQVINNLGKRVWAFDEIELRNMIQKAGARVIDWAGVRLETDDDRREIKSVNPKELTGIVEREAKLSRDPKLKAKGQMLHFIAKKP